MMLVVTQILLINISLGATVGKLSAVTIHSVAAHVARGPHAIAVHSVVLHAIAVRPVITVHPVMVKPMGHAVAVHSYCLLHCREVCHCGSFRYGPSSEQCCSWYVSSLLALQGALPLQSFLLPLVLQGGTWSILSWFMQQFSPPQIMSRFPLPVPPWLRLWLLVLLLLSLRLLLLLLLLLRLLLLSLQLILLLSRPLLLLGPLLLLQLVPAPAIAAHQPVMTSAPPPSPSETQFQ
jgi:hypothetical protein